MQELFFTYIDVVKCEASLANDAVVRGQYSSFHYFYCLKEKSKLDWDLFKGQEGIQDELRNFNKDGFVEQLFSHFKSSTDFVRPGFKLHPTRVTCRTDSRREASIYRFLALTRVPRQDINNIVLITCCLFSERKIINHGSFVHCLERNSYFDCCFTLSGTWKNRHFFKGQMNGSLRWRNRCVRVQGKNNTSLFFSYCQSKCFLSVLCWPNNIQGARGWYSGLVCPSRAVCLLLYIC